MEVLFFFTLVCSLSLHSSVAASKVSLRGAHSQVFTKAGREQIHKLPAHEIPPQRLILEMKPNSPESKRKGLAAGLSIFAGLTAVSPAVAANSITSSLVTLSALQMNTAAGTARIILRIVQNQFVMSDREDAFGGIPYKLTEPLLKPTRKLFPMGAEGVDPTPVFWVLGCSLLNEVLTSSTGILAKIANGG
eukprot:jgi/Bigna1/135983/aug1.31_g10691